MPAEVAPLASLSREKLDLIKQTVAKGATDLELQLFFHACQRTGLDPLMKQMYAIKRWNSADKRETLTFQTGIDGYRLIADRTGQYAGSSDAEYELNDEGFPAVAKVTVTKLVAGTPCPFTASARWSEYVQRTREGKPTSMWERMPFLMLAKCAEALALRKAFPAELSGVYTHEEMTQADSETRATTMDHKREAQAKINELRQDPPEREAAGAETTPSDAAPQASDSGSGPMEDPAEPYRAKLRTCEQSVAALNTTFHAIPDTIRQDCHEQYTKQLRAVGKKR